MATDSKVQRFNMRYEVIKDQSFPSSIWASSHIGLSPSLLMERMEVQHDTYHGQSLYLSILPQGYLKMTMRTVASKVLTTSTDFEDLQEGKYVQPKLLLSLSRKLSREHNRKSGNPEATGSPVYRSKILNIKSTPRLTRATETFRYLRGLQSTRRFVTRGVKLATTRIVDAFLETRHQQKG